MFAKRVTSLWSDSVDSIGSIMEQRRCYDD